MSIAISSPTKNVKDKNCENKILKKLQEHLCKRYLKWYKILPLTRINSLSPS